MTNDAMWATLMMGIGIGVVCGFTAAWRLARKLEWHGVTLAAWDEEDWQKRQSVAIGRLRRVANDR